MPQISSTDAEGFYAWSRILVEGQAPLINAEEGVLLDFFGQDDETFLVVDIYIKMKRQLPNMFFFQPMRMIKIKHFCLSSIFCVRLNSV
ncbi:MAG: hypothetical protein RL748_3924 [Pseudomonadota bacterium]